MFNDSGSQIGLADQSCERCFTSESRSEMLVWMRVALHFYSALALWLIGP
jgi:hypothetical protein